MLDNASLVQICSFKSLFLSRSSVLLLTYKIQLLKLYSILFKRDVEAAFNLQSNCPISLSRQMLL